MFTNTPYCFVQSLTGNEQTLSSRFYGCCVWTRLAVWHSSSFLAAVCTFSCSHSAMLGSLCHVSILLVACTHLLHKQIHILSLSLFLLHTLYALHCKYTQHTHTHTHTHTHSLSLSLSRTHSQNTNTLTLDTHTHSHSTHTHTHGPSPRGPRLTGPAVSLSLQLSHPLISPSHSHHIPTPTVHAALQNIAIPQRASGINVCTLSTNLHATVCDAGTGCGLPGYPGVSVFANIYF